VRRSSTAVVAVIAALIFSSATPSHAATPKLSVPKKVSVSVTSSSARLSWGLTKGLAPTKISITCKVYGISAVSTTSKKSHITLNNLTPATSYDCKLVSVLGKKRGAAKSLSFTTAVDAVVPTRPYSVLAVAHDHSATISWHAPSSDGGAPITSYVVTSTPSSAGCNVALTTCTITGLTNGVSYTFNVVAHNAAGNSLLSVNSNLIVPSDTSVAINNVQTTPGDGYLDVSWHLLRAADNVQISWGSQSVTLAGDVTSYRITGLSNCIAQSISLNTVVSTVATTAVTTSAQAGGASGIPGAIRNLSATTTSRAVHVAFAAPTFTGFTDTPITGYVVTAINGANSFTATVDASATSADLTGLDNGVSYSISVAAVNQCGTHIVTDGEKISATPSWANRPATVIDMSDPNAVTQHTLAVGDSVGYQFTALDTFATAGVYFALEPLCSTNGSTWGDCAVTVSVSLYDLSGNQLNTIQYAYSDWYGTHVIPVRPEAPLTQDAQYILVVRLDASTAAYTAIDVFSPALVW
jgi:hypothetical protein